MGGVTTATCLRGSIGIVSRSCAAMVQLQVFSPQTHKGTEKTNA
jgi:hypothetical protein